MTDEQKQKTRELLEYLWAWSDARETYFAWIEEEYQKRRGQWETQRQRGRRALSIAVKGLKFGNDGRVRNGVGALRAKGKFRTQRDRVLQAVVVGGQLAFGIRGEWTAAGLFVGTMTGDTRQLVVRQIRKACDV